MKTIGILLTEKDRLRLIDMKNHLKGIDMNKPREIDKINTLKQIDSNRHGERRDRLIERYAQSPEINS